MKKILSLILAVFMIASVFAVNVSAETVVGNTDGVNTFDPTTTGGQNINVKVLFWSNTPPPNMQKSRM